MNPQGESPSSPQGIRGTISLRACIVLGAAIGGFAALGAMRLGEAFGSFLPIAAAAFGALAGRVFFQPSSGKRTVRFGRTMHMQLWTALMMEVTPQTKLMPR